MAILEQSIGSFLNFKRVSRNLIDCEVGGLVFSLSGGMSVVLSCGGVDTFFAKFVLAGRLARLGNVCGW